MTEGLSTAAATRADEGGVPLRTHALAAVLFGAGLFGLWGGLPALWGLGLGALAVAAACVITARAQLRHHPTSRAELRVTPRSLLGAWCGAGPVLFMMVLPEDTGPAVLAPLAALLATVFFVAIRLEDSAHATAESSSAEGEH